VRVCNDDDDDDDDDESVCAMMMCACICLHLFFATRLRCLKFAYMRVNQCDFHNQMECKCVCV
jgi:hypothetical protein